MSKPLFQIAVGDPTRVGDAVRGYTVYTVKTRTTSPHYRKGEFSVLRRFSDFLWLFETLTMNNPGVIVPPVPDKHPFGRFQDTFIETRRLALQRCLTKVTAHPVLQLDPDLRLFLESDHFATESKNRRAEAQQEAGSKGLLSGWTGPKFVEQDDWFDSRRAFLDSLESQLRGLSKSLEAASKSRLDLATSIGEFASSITALAESDLGSAMCSALARLNDLAVREKEGNEEQAKAEVVNLLNLSDEYVRFIGSVRMAFAGRVKSYERWQIAEREVGRLRANREKLRQQGKLGDRGPQTLAEIGEVGPRSLCRESADV
jgi:sorting nexin-1/2